MEKKNLSFVQACQEFFGRKQDQGLKDFMLEVRALTPKDRAEMKEGLEKALNAVVEA